jgi:hypothetical protein
MMESRNKELPKKEEQIMAQNELLENTETPELDELDVPEADLDDFGDEDVEDVDDLDGLSSDLDRWADDEDGYGGYSDRDYIYGLLR